MKIDWRKSKKTFDGHKLVEHVLNQNLRTDPPAQYETALVGRRGEIWEYSSTHYSVLLTHSGTANVVAELLGSPMRVKRGDELVLRFAKNRLPDVVSHLRIPKSHATRVRLANQFRDKK